MLKEQLQKQIEQEAIDGANAKGNTDYAYGWNKGYEAGYEAAGEKYAEKWQAAEARAERAEKALREILALRKSVGAAYDMQIIAIEALNPKTSTDE